MGKWEMSDKFYQSFSLTSVNLISNKYNQLLIDVLTYPSSSSRAHVILYIVYKWIFTTPHTIPLLKVVPNTDFAFIPPPPPDCIFFFISIYHEPTTNRTTTLARRHLVYFLWKTCSIMWQWFSSRGDCSLGTVKKNRGNF